MNENPLFDINTPAPRAGFLQQVLLTISNKQRTSRLWRIRVSVSAGIVALVALVPVGISLVQAFEASHFGAYLSLVFTDTAVVFASWKDIGASLLESLPFAMLTITLALVGILIWAMRTAAQSMSHASFITTNA